MMAQLELAWFWTALGSAVVSFLWQGVCVGALTALLLRCLRQAGPRARYATGMGALVVSLLLFLGTFVGALVGSASTAVVDLDAGLAGALAAGPTEGAGSGVQGLAAWAWCIGVLCLTVRCALHGRAAQRLKTCAVSAPEPHWLRLFDTLKHELGITRALPLLKSGLAEVPMVVGWFSPVVLVPAAALTSLSTDQLRALLAHELAHVRRHDPLLNALQALVEIALFFHPVVWWISKQVRAEREYCCDDTSIRATGSPKLLAKALADLEALRLPYPARTVLAADGGPLMQRIERILGVRPSGRTSLSNWQLPTGLALASLLALAGTSYASDVGPHTSMGRATTARFQHPFHVPIYATAAGRRCVRMVRRSRLMVPSEFRGSDRKISTRWVILARSTPSASR